MSIKKILAAAGLALLATQAWAISFAPGHLYSTSETAINEYNASGQLLGSLLVNGGQMRGLSFGPDGLLYVVRDNPTFFGPASVQALKADGSVVRTYNFTGTISGNISYGKIAFDGDGSHFYVGASNGLYRFATAGSSGSQFVNTDAMDVEVLPNGEVLSAAGSGLRRYSSGGALLGTVSQLADPLGITGDSFPFLSDVRGVEFDAATNRTFVSMLGYSGVVNMSFKLLALDGNSNRIVAMESYWYADDLFVGDGANLLVGSRTLAPGLFTTRLDYLGAFSGPEARFVTALPVPEPATVLFWLLGLPGLLLVARRRS